MSSPPCVGPMKLLDETPEASNWRSPGGQSWGSKRASSVASRETLEREGPASPRLAPLTHEC